IDPLKLGILPHGIDYWLASFYENPPTILESFRNPPIVFWHDALEVTRAADGIVESYRQKFRDQIQSRQAVPDPATLYANFDDLKDKVFPAVEIKKIHVEGIEKEKQPVVTFKAYDTSDLSTVVRASREAKKD